MRHTAIQWRQWVLLAEIAVLFGVGFIPGGEWDVPANSLVSLVCALQVVSFQKVEGISYASTMCTGNLRSGTDALFRSVHDREPGELHKALHYYGIIVCFISGAAAGALLLSNVGPFMFLLAPAGLCVVFFLISSRRKLAGWRRKFRSVFRRKSGR